MLLLIHYIDRPQWFNRAVELLWHRYQRIVDLKGWLFLRGWKEGVSLTADKHI